MTSHVTARWAGPARGPRLSGLRARPAGPAGGPAGRGSGRGAGGEAAFTEVTVQRHGLKAANSITGTIMLQVPPTVTSHQSRMPPWL